ncbi:MAG TPA: glycosyltransferase family 9 protein [Ktedonobacteraceae bacterium]|nr:glycosyltransferase family 9 protein [Ktedonobacteraceae bacterium]
MKRLLRGLILLLVRLYGIPGARAAARRARSAAVPASPRILLIRPDHLGDLVLTTPVLHALRQQLPDAHITMAVGPWSSEIVARHPDLDRVVVLPFPGFSRAPQKPLAPYTLLYNAARQLRRGHYDLAVNLRPDFWWGAALLYLAAIPCRAGYALPPATPFLTHALPFTTPELASVSNLRLLSLDLRALGGKPLLEPWSPSVYPLLFRPTTEEQRQVNERLQQAGIDETIPIIVIHPGSGAAVKLWRSDGWARIAEQLPARLTFSPPARIILTGSKSEQALLDETAQAMRPEQGQEPLILTSLSIGQLAALLGRAMLVLGVDNGPLHIAVAQGTPTLQIYGPTDPRIFGPWGNPERHRVLASTERCASCPAIPCGRLDFTPEELPAHPCVRNLAELTVMDAIQPLLVND